MHLFNIKTIKNKNEVWRYIFHEKLNIYDKVIENTIDNTKGNIIYKSLKNIDIEYNYHIHEDFKRGLNNIIYLWYVYCDFLLLRFKIHVS